MNNISKEIKMICPICGNDQFELEYKEYENINDAPDEANIKCSDCGTSFSKEDLIEENSELIDIAIEDLKKEVVEQLEAKIKKEMTKW